MGPTYYRGCWHVVSSPLFNWYHHSAIKLLHYFSQLKALYTPRGFFGHAASLGQAFAHCPRFSAAASRRSGVRVSVPLRPATLSGRLPVIGLVSHYLTNYLIGRRLISKRLKENLKPLILETCVSRTTWRISPSFPELSSTWR